MFSLSKITPSIVKFLRTNLPHYQIYSYVPKDSQYPLVRLGTMTQEPWYTIGSNGSCILTVELEVWSNDTSSKGCIIALDQVSEAILNHHVFISQCNVANSVIKHRQVEHLPQPSMWRGVVMWQLWLERGH